MALYLAHFDALMPVPTGMTSWFEAGVRTSLKARINVQQPSGY
jgi:hypothetical protein